MVGSSVNGLDSLTPIARETAQDRVYGQLRRALIRGNFDAGEQFFAGDVADRMSVSSMPVREALARLVSERALEATPNRRVRVPLLTRDRAADVANARKLIEAELLRLAAPNLKRADLSRLEALTYEYEETSRSETVADLNYAFHFSIYERAGSPVLLNVAESLWMQAGPFARAALAFYDPKVDQSATRFHHEIIDGLRRGDSDLSIASLNADITQAYEILMRAPDAVWHCAEATEE